MPGPRVAGTVLHLESRPLATRHGTATLHVCRDLVRRTYLLVIAYGDATTPEPLLARVHSSCVTSETFGGCDCDCAEQLDAALGRIAAAGRGVVFYLDQEGRGAGFTAKVRDRMLVQASGGRIGTYDAYARMGLASDCRTYDAIAGARAVLGIGAPLVVLSNNPEKLAALDALGVAIAGTVPLTLRPSPFNRHYLAAKAAAGHRLALGPDDAEAAPPESVAVTAPHALPAAPHLVHVGSYWLPVASRSPDDAATPRWLRLHTYVDARHGRDRVVLEYGDGRTPFAPVRLQHESLVERVPAPTLGLQKARWYAALRVFAADGAGVAVMLADKSGDSLFADRDDPSDVATSAFLARRHLGERIAVPLAHDDRDGRVWTSALAAAGASVAAVRPLAVV